jgi:hypothetical protein
MKSYRVWIRVIASTIFHFQSSCIMMVSLHSSGVCNTTVFPTLSKWIIRFRARC